MCLVLVHYCRVIWSGLSLFWFSLGFRCSLKRVWTLAKWEDSSVLCYRFVVHICENDLHRGEWQNIILQNWANHQQKCSFFLFLSSFFSDLDAKMSYSSRLFPPPYASPLLLAVRSYGLWLVSWQRYSRGQDKAVTFLTEDGMNTFTSRVMGAGAAEGRHRSEMRGRSVLSLGTWCPDHICCIHNKGFRGRWIVYPPGYYWMMSQNEGLLQWGHDSSAWINLRAYVKRREGVTAQTHSC